MSDRELERLQRQFRECVNQRRVLNDVVNTLRNWVLFLVCWLVVQSSVTLIGVYLYAS